MSMISAQCVYWDLKDRPASGQAERKARLAGHTLKKLKVVGFFELTSRKYVAEHLRLNIRRSDIEKIDPSRLTNPEGCIKLEAEYLGFDEIAAKQRDHMNGFHNVGRLCDKKWRELQEMCRSPKLLTGEEAWSPKKQGFIIMLTHDLPDVRPTLERLGLI
jgi:hypothetical protein